VLIMNSNHRKDRERGAGISGSVGTRFPVSASNPSAREDSLASTVISFGRLLKDNGFAVSTPSVMDALEGISCIGVENPHDFKTILKSTFMSSTEEAPAFERLFDEFWIKRLVRATAPEETSDGPEHGDSPDKARVPRDSMVLAEAGVAHSQEQEARHARPFVMYSPGEILREQDFRDLELGRDQRMDRLIREILSPLIRRVGYRTRPASSGMSLDFRRMLRRNVRHGGEILEFPRIKPRLRLKKLVFLCDVSGSMNPYLRFMLRFIKEIQQIPTRVETFVFATRLTRVTPLLVHLPFNRALKEIERQVLDWSGGTRIGLSLQRFTSDYGGAMLRPSTVVLVHSDGWDRGDPDLLEKEMTKIQRKAYRVLWINPLLGGPSYEPTCRGMRAALPLVDSFLPGHSIAGLERVAGTLRGLF